MPKLVFDIETVGVEFDSLDEISKNHLLEFAENEEERKNIRNELGFSPLTGRVIAVGILNPDTEKGAVYFQSHDNTPAGGEIKLDKKTASDEEVQYVPCSDEKEILKNFWDAAQHYRQFVSFNGHSFDCPYLMIRSAVNEIKPSVSLMHNRYAPGPHIDILDRLTNFGAVRGKRNLHLWCQAFGIESPKDKGISGEEVARYFNEGKILDIAKYCYGDIKSTAKLFEYWEKFIK
ncbi:MAG: hypothetical protein UW43_C0005G0002 [Candidatus Yanofskybacteria bacterium GW2011_GWA1_44_21]|uniref:Predicted 3'-5' exonuclease PolB-like domain-containing protein n=2 Tax=Candidatus Yanofskyibacteriota TaxID=1752733 RepID=A0A1F8GZH9_9BACT|nr:MAG: hypothetical protein UW14_C0004G0028 [Candidatus Yanofskybacteria bacterium GW2011_GWA2_44_10]KKT50509.1 MAG: hypothetical protein UW43_C0005G0002 [Candidatus Yanofskybacteria bacterium GW2011_GWA1_44_21]KKT90299.1 MAG: hypothetical protein UW90_C0003G0023 [Candidatus Yanofskybacteria bacterium GW2011_GWB1_45_11]OGN03046.1 MAG: hypothetical protein A2657_00675 [Candidatus Yanofskybacteria bacterium RIFCSPHIGHO2_01_FULL_44_110b]OGN14544.1 MAG: hypothetical protein A3C01_00450 [Candidatus